MFKAGSTTIWILGSAVDMAQEILDHLQSGIDDFNELTGWQVTMWEMGMAILASVTLLAVSAYLWDEIKEACYQEEDRNEACPDSPTTSAQGSPVQSDDESGGVSGKWVKDLAETFRGLSEN